MTQHQARFPAVQYRIARNYFLISSAVIACITLLAATRAHAASPQAIDAAIKKGVEYIYSQQKPTGRWETDPKRDGDRHEGATMQGDTWGGFSALSTYALVAAGESPKDKRVASAVDFLKTADIIGIYSLGLRAQVWHLLANTPAKEAEYQKLIDADTKLILAGINMSGDNKGLWDYRNGIGERIDHSVSQYGILGLWALQDSGAKVDLHYWQLFDQTWRDHQLNDGGWAYNSTKAHMGSKDDASASMTAAGIATLFITGDRTAVDPADHRGNIFNTNIENGLQWMDKHFTEVRTNYAWYGVERIGAASGTKYFGTKDWFEAGANELVGLQTADGSWRGHSTGSVLTDTCFAVLFLARGRAPIMFNKVMYNLVDDKNKPQPGNWNERPRDAANLAKWTGDRIETTLNWQLVNLKVAPEELRDAPILYLAGDQELNLSSEEQQKLKTFVQEGGMILGNADFNSQNFADSFTKMGTKLFGYEFRPLPPNSPIYSEQTHLKQTRIRVKALSNGIREMMVLLEYGDPGRYWQKPPTIPNDESMQMGANIFLYAVDKTNLVTRGQTNVVVPSAVLKATHSVRFARLQYGGNWDPEPGGWLRLAAILHNHYRTDLDVTTLKLSDDSLAAPAGKGTAPLKIAHLTGTATFNLTDAELTRLKQFIANGGTLIIDAGGGSSQFATSAEAILKKLFPAEIDDALAHPLTLDDPLYKLAEAPIPSVDYRAYARNVLSDIHMPRVVGIRQGGRIVAYYSREDLSAGLVGQPTDGIVGYAPATATAIMRNIIFSIFPPPPPASMSTDSTPRHTHSTAEPRPHTRSSSSNRSTTQPTSRPTTNPSQN
jgi:hypothetical protein